MTVPSSASRYCLVDRYDLQQPLPDGSVGVITMAAYDRQRQTPVTLKILLNQDPFPWDLLEGLEREAMILDALDHPGLPQPLGRFEFEAADLDRDPRGGFAFVWRAQFGRSLDQLLRSGYTFSESEVRQIAKQVMGTLRYLHQRRPPVIHRDICPRNLLLQKDPAGLRLQLLNFGDAQTLVGTEDRSAGTAGYMAPELGQTAANPSSELYSLGATLIQLVTGLHPADQLGENGLEPSGDTTDATQIQAQLLLQVRRHCSPAFAEWLAWLVQPDPLERPRSVTEAIEGGQRLREQERRDRQALLRSQSRSRLGRQLLDRVEQVERQFLVPPEDHQPTESWAEDDRPAISLGEPLRLKPRLQPRLKSQLQSRLQPLNLLPARSRRPLDIAYDREALGLDRRDNGSDYGPDYDRDYELDYDPRNEVDYDGNYESYNDDYNNYDDPSVIDGPTRSRRTLTLDDRSPFPRPDFSGIDIQRSHHRLTILLPSSQIQVLPGQQRRRRSPRVQTFVDQTVGRWFCQARLAIDPMDISLERWCLGVRYTPPIGTAHRNRGDISIRRGPLKAQLWLQIGRWRCSIEGTPAEIEWVGAAIADQLQLPIQR
jgi:serine/threonine protein kinase